MARTPYGVIGGYGNGVWLVAKGGKGVIADRQHLPAQGTGYQYYYLGSTPDKANVRLFDALSKLNVKTATDRIDFNSITKPAFQGKVVTLPGQPHGVLGSLQTALREGVFFAPPGVGAAAAGETATVAAGAEAAGAGAAGASVGAGALLGTAGIIASTTDFLNWIAWIFHPVNILRAVEFLLGSILMGIGLWSLLSRGQPAASDNIARVSRELASATPVGRAQRMARGRRMGRKEGETEHARLEGRRDTRKKLSEASARNTQRRGQRRSQTARS